MVTRRVVELVDDLDGTPADETVAFALDGVRYELDLSDDNASRLREQLEPFTEAARRVGGRRRGAKGRAQKNT